jgi:hypothetical protein
MMYNFKDDQVLLIWKVAKCLSKIRELSDTTELAQVITEAEALLNALVLQLEPLARDHAPYLGRSSF